MDKAEWGVARVQKKSKEGRCSQKARSLNEQMVYLWRNLRVRGELMRCSLGRVGRQGAQQGLEKSKVRADHDQQGRPRVRAGSHGSSGAPERSSLSLSPFSPPSSLHFPPDLSSSPSGSFLLFSSSCFPVLYLTPPRLPPWSSASQPFPSLSPRSSLPFIVFPFSPLPFLAVSCLPPHPHSACLSADIRYSLQGICVACSDTVPCPGMWRMSKISTCRKG